MKKSDPPLPPPVADDADPPRLLERSTSDRSDADVCSVASAVQLLRDLPVDYDVDAGWKRLQRELESRRRPDASTTFYLGGEPDGQDDDGAASA